MYCSHPKETGSRNISRKKHNTRNLIKQTNGSQHFLCLFHQIHTIICSTPVNWIEGAASLVQHNAHQFLLCARVSYARPDIELACLSFGSLVWDDARLNKPWLSFADP